MKEFIRVLLREMLAEAVPTGHFNDRVKERITNIQSIVVPPNCYQPNVPKETQDQYLIKQIQEKVLAKVQAVIDKTYPAGKKLETGICAIVPLGLIKIQPPIGLPIKVTINAEGGVTGQSYYIGIYDNRMPSIVLADPKIPANHSIGGQLEAHMKNNEREGHEVNRAKSFIDKSFMSDIILSTKGVGV